MTSSEPGHGGESAPPPAGDEPVFSLGQMRDIQQQLTRFTLEYEFGLREIETKISILRDEFTRMHDYNPIEHVSTRVKSPESIMRKISRRGLSTRGEVPDLDLIRDNLTDIAGVRVTCSFVADTYRLFDLLTGQQDVKVQVVKDYIEQPKSNGYMSLHVIVEIPVFLSTGMVNIPVEIQFRTIAMDFWASLEHKIYYKFEGKVPGHLHSELKDAAATAAHLDAKMAQLHRELHGPGTPVTREGQT